MPLVGLAVLPLQLAAWLLRGFVFEYLALTALGAYLTHYRLLRAVGVAAGATRMPGQTSRMINYDTFLSRAAAQMQESAIRRMGTVLAQARDIISFAPGYPAPETFPWDEFQEIARELLSGARRQRAAVRTDPRLPAAARRDRRRSWQHRGVRPSLDRLLVTTGSQQGLDLVARVLLDPGDVVLVELPTYTGAITAFRNVQAQHGRRAAGGRRHRPRRRSTTPTQRLGARAAASRCSTSCRTSRTRPAC